MFWKTFFISFVLNNKNNMKFILLDKKNSHNFVSETIPRRPRSYSDELDSEKNKSFFYQKSGYDNRDLQSDETDIIFNITEFYTKMDLLKKLENKNISESVKIELIKNYKNDLPSGLTYNNLAGGLYDDWDFVMEN